MVLRFEVLSGRTPRSQSAYAAAHVHASFRPTLLRSMLNPRPQRPRKVWKLRLGAGNKSQGLPSRRTHALLVLGCVLGGLLLLSIVALAPHNSSHDVLPVKANQDLVGSRRELGVGSAKGPATATTAPLDAVQAPGQQQQRQQQQKSLARGKQGSSAVTSAASSSSGSGQDTGSSFGLHAKAPATAGTGSSAAHVVQAAGGAAQTKETVTGPLLAAAGNDSSPQQQQGAAAPQLYDVDPADATSMYIQKRAVEPARLKYPVWWMGPLWSGSGYSSGMQCENLSMQTM